MLISLLVRLPLLGGRVENERENTFIKMNLSFELLQLLRTTFFGDAPKDYAMEAEYFTD